MTPTVRRYSSTSLLGLLLVSTACSSAPEGHWYRGNTHTHSLWSDGDAAPEFVVAWYKDRNYDWLSLTDHDVLLRGDRWYSVTENGRLTPSRLSELRERFGEDWVETREVGGASEMRLLTLQMLRDHFEEDGSFLLIEGEEIGDRSEGKPLHFNVLNPAELIPAQGGETIEAALARNIGVVNHQAAQTGRNMLVHFNHPNYHWAVTAEQLAMMDGTTFFEVYNGSTECNNFGDSTHPGMDELWDIANTLRLTQTDLGPLLGVANDDTHNYFDIGPDRSNPGRGWIMVRADTLSTDAILDAIRAGDFYSSTGVELKDVRREESRYVVEIAPEEGITYTTRFLGTRMRDGSPGEPGVILHETSETTAVYDYSGDELYVRAKVISSRMQTNPLLGEEAPEYAWTQPIAFEQR